MSGGEGPARRRLVDAPCGPSPGARPACFTMDMVHVVPYSRGTISTAMMLHHALWLWAVAVRRPGDGEEAAASRRTRLLGECLPAWAEGLMPDALAWTFWQREERFIDDGFWEALRSTSVERPWHTKATVLRCICGLWDEEGGEWNWKDSDGESNQTAERVPAEEERVPSPAVPPARLHAQATAAAAPHWLLGPAVPAALARLRATRGAGVAGRWALDIGGPSWLPTVHCVKLFRGPFAAGALNGLIAPIAKLKVKLRASSVGAESRFQTEMWVPLQSVYKGLDQSIIPIFIEWVVAYCEQCKVDLPSWMMTKNQHEAKIKLEEALESGDQKKLRESAVFAKQANYKSDPSLESLYEECIRKLKALKRLPSGWEVDDLLGEEGEAKMFKKMDFGTEVERRMFQKLFDDTNLGILTRDRGARDKSGLGAKMPRAFQVTSVQMVMNAESWDSYSQRLDQ
ncbi:unnamed protein product, partial [Prorocentrum cordatum]